MASVSWVDGSGSATLANGFSAPLNRFSNWTPDIEPVGPRNVSLGTGLVTQWVHRTDYVVSFELDKLPNTTLSLALRLKAHLLTGGICTVATDDPAANTYLCFLRPGSEPAITFSDRRRLRYSMRLDLKNSADSPLLCEYV